MVRATLDLRYRASITEGAKHSGDLSKKITCASCDCAVQHSSPDGTHAQGSVGGCIRAMAPPAVKRDYQ